MLSRIKDKAFSAIFCLPYKRTRSHQGARAYDPFCPSHFGAVVLHRSIASTRLNMAGVDISREMWASMDEYAFAPPPPVSRLRLLTMWY